MNTHILKDYVQRGLVRYQQHPTKNLMIWNYTDLVQAKGPWDDITTKTRGLITTVDGDIIAHSFRKFHNLEQQKHTPSEDGRFEVFEKVDGSLGILFYYDGEWSIASRGSFTSDQAKTAQSILDTMFGTQGIPTDLPKDIAYSFEIIYPDNRIVVDYGQRRELVFLAAFYKDGTEAITYNGVDVRVMMQNYGFHVATSYAFDDYTNIKQLNWNNKEGFVVRFSNGERVKIKFEEYLTLHRVVTNLNALRVWELFHAKVPFEKAIDGVPDEFHTWFEEVYTTIEKQYMTIKKHHETTVAHYVAITNSRKEFACAVAKIQDPSIHSKIVFAMYNGRDTHEMISLLVKPVDGMHQTPWVSESRIQPPTKKNEEHQQLPTQKIIITVGPSGCGKSTWATDYIHIHTNTVRVNRDTLRTLMFNCAKYYDDPRVRQREQLVTNTEMSMIHSYLRQGLNVIIDNTNLRKEYLTAYIKEFKEYTIEYKVFDVDIETCIYRDATRNTPVGSLCIQKQFERFEALKAVYAFHTHMPLADEIVKQDPALPHAYIFDIDGTIADNTQRPPFDWSRVSEDTCIDSVIETLKGHASQGCPIILCSGRDSCCRDETIKWLEKYAIPYNELHMRPRGDMRPDWRVKELMWKDILQRYYIVAMYDDRNSVVQHARRCGFKVYQVAEGNF